MFPVFPLGPFEGALARLPLVISAALVAFAIVLASERPLTSCLLLVLSCGAVVPPIIARIRFRRLLMSGDVHGIMNAWKRTVRDVPGATAVEPLMSALAFAAYGWVDEARRQLQMVRFRTRGSANPEHILFVEILIEAFDGDRAQAIERADAIASLPVPDVGKRLQHRVVMLRASLGALTRAFAHRARTGDLEMLEHVSQSSPLVSWAMRYAAAIVAIDDNDMTRARKLIEGAPSWPEQSAFRSFHEEIEAVIGR